MQLHALALATFASLIAPFGGFFASGLKRTFKIKDFGDSIPGHGGMTDRMDCQFIMGLFAYLYFHSFIAEDTATLAGAMDLFHHLTLDDQVAFLPWVFRYFVNKFGSIQELSEYLVKHSSQDVLIEVCHISN